MARASSRSFSGTPALESAARAALRFASATRARSASIRFRSAASSWAFCSSSCFWSAVTWALSLSSPLPFPPPLSASSAGLSFPTSAAMVSPMAFAVGRSFVAAFTWASTTGVIAAASASGFSAAAIISPIAFLSASSITWTPYWPAARFARCPRGL